MMKLMNVKLLFSLWDFYVLCGASLFSVGHGCQDSVFSVEQRATLNVSDVPRGSVLLLHHPQLSIGTILGADRGAVALRSTVWWTPGYYEALQNSIWHNLVE